MGDLFGGQKTESFSKSTPVDVTADEYAGLRGPFADALKQLFSGTPGNPLSGIPQAPGPLAAPIGTNETQVLQMLMDDLKGPRQDLLRSTLAGNFLPGQPGANPFVDSAIQTAQRPTLQGLEEVLGRTLPGRFTLAGQQTQPNSSSAFDRAAAIATRGAADALGDIATKISFGAHEAERGRQQEGIRLGQQEVQTMVTSLQAQALPRMIQDLGIERGMAEFKGRMDALLKALALVTGTPTSQYAQESEATQKGQVKPNIFHSLFPLGSGSIPMPVMGGGG